MNDTDDNTTDSNKSEHQFEVKKAGKVKPPARAGKNFTPYEDAEGLSGLPLFLNEYFRLVLLSMPSIIECGAS